MVKIQRIKMRGTYRITRINSLYTSGGQAFADIEIGGRRVILQNGELTIDGKKQNPEPVEGNLLQRIFRAIADAWTQRKMGTLVQCGNESLKVDSKGRLYFNGRRTVDAEE